MGLIDSVTKEYMSSNRRFADVYNYFLYGGKQVIAEEDLREQDTTELFNLLDKSGTMTANQQFRDVLKQTVVKTDGQLYYLLMGIENQSEIHYAMPVKNQLYDAINYATQVSKQSKIHRAKKDLRGAEFLSGFSKEDRICYK